MPLILQHYQQSWKEENAPWMGLGSRTKDNDPITTSCHLFHCHSYYYCFCPLLPLLLLPPLSVDVTVVVVHYCHYCCYSLLPLSLLVSLSVAFVVAATHTITTVLLSLSKSMPHPTHFHWLTVKISCTLRSMIHKVAIRYINCQILNSVLLPLLYSLIVTT